MSERNYLVWAEIVTRANRKGICTYFDIVLLETIFVHTSAMTYRGGVSLLSAADSARGDPYL